MHTTPTRQNQQGKQTDPAVWACLPPLLLILILPKERKSSTARNATKKL